MRPAALLWLALALVVAAPASAARASNTRTSVRLTKPATANATVAGFELDLVKVHEKKHKARRATSAAVPRGVSIFAVVAKQKRSDRVRGVLVAVNRASAVRASGSAVQAAARKLTVNLHHAAVPKGYRLKLKLTESANVLSRHHPFSCRGYFKTSDLAGAVRFAGPNLPDITIGTLIQAACAAARKNPAPFAALGEFRSALNAPSGTLAFAASITVPNQIDGTATFNYGVRAFAVLADKGHQFTGCAFAAGTCTVGSTAHPNDYVVFRPTSPAAAGAPLPIALSIAPGPKPRLPFQFFGFDSGNHRQGPLLTSGP